MKILFLIICLIWISYPVNSYDRTDVMIEIENNAVIFAKIESTPTFPEYLFDYNSIRRLEINAYCQEELPAEFVNFSSLKELIVTNSPMLDYDMFSLMINKMDIESLMITGSGLKSLPKLNSGSLVSLDVSNNSITEFPEYLLQNNRNLEIFRVHHNHIRSIHISKKNSILKSFAFHDNMIEHISGLSNLDSLKSLSVGNNPLKLKELVNEVKGIEGLKILSLSGPEYEDQIHHLKELKHLDTIILSDMKITEEQIEGLQKALPDLNIIKDICNFR